TTSETSLKKMILADSNEKEAVLQLVATAENQSEHPLAQDSVKGVQEQGIQLLTVEGFEALPGYGIEATVDGKVLLVGTRKLMNERQVDLLHYEAQMENLENEGKTAMIIAIDNKIAGVIAVAD